MKYLLHDILKWSFSERKETGGMDVKIQRNQRMLAAFCMLGFAVGIVYANLMTRDYIGNIGIFNDFFLQQYGMIEIDMPDYLWYLGRIRILPVVLLAMLGYTRFRRVVVSAFLLWTGFSCGMIMTASVLQMGIQGLILCLIGMTPHMIFYIAGYLILIWYFYTYPVMRWNAQKTVSIILFLAIGLVLEAYVNPILMQGFLKTL